MRVPRAIGLVTLADLCFAPCKMKRLLIGVLGLGAAVAALLFAWIGINALDEELSPEAQALVAAAAPRSGPIDATNAVVWMSALTAPQRDDPLEYAQRRLGAALGGGRIDNRAPELALPTLADCKPEESYCLPLMSDQAAAIEKALSQRARHAQLTARMRAAPVFKEVAGAATPGLPVSDARGLLYAQSLLLAYVRVAATVGDWREVVDDLEEDMAFNRRALGGFTDLTSKLVAIRAVGRNALFTAQLWQCHGEDLRAYGDRLKALAVPVSDVDLSLSRSAQRDVSGFIAVMQSQGRNSLPILAGEQSPNLLGRFEALFFQPRATANAFAARLAPQLPALTGETRAFDDARDAIKSLGVSKDRTRWYWPPSLLNPVGKFLAEAFDTDYTTYQASAHDVQAVLTLVRARLELPAKAMPEDWAALLDDPRWVDPYTGQRLRLDQNLGQAAVVARRGSHGIHPMLKVTNGRLVADLPTPR